MEFFNSTFFQFLTHIHAQTDKHTDRHRDRQTDRQTDLPLLEPHSLYLSVVLSAQPGKISTMYIYT